MWIDEEVNQNDENLRNMLQKIAETLGKGCNPQKEKNAATVVLPRGLSVIKYSVLNVSLKFIFIFTF